MRSSDTPLVSVILLDWGPCKVFDNISLHRLVKIFWIWDKKFFESIEIFSDMITDIYFYHEYQPGGEDVSIYQMRYIGLLFLRGKTFCLPLSLF